MKGAIALTQRVDITPHGERRDAIDQRWYTLVQELGYTPLVIPNDPNLASRMVSQTSIQGLILTGGNDLRVCGGTAPERDDTEQVLLEWAKRKRLGVVGVCRGMQLMLCEDGARFHRVHGHAGQRVQLEIAGKLHSMNSYHNWAAARVSNNWNVWAQSLDGVIKAVRHIKLPLIGVMWHPEREPQLSPFDRQQVFSILDQGTTTTCVH